MSLVTLDILGVPVTSAPMPEMIAHLNAQMGAGRRLKLAFLNAHASNLAAKDAAFRAALDGFLILNDGVGVDIAARRLHGVRFPDNLNGTDFVPAWLQQTKAPLRLYLLGGREGVAGEAAERLRALAPQHVIAGAANGYFPPEKTGEIVAAVAAAEADILLVAFGNPAQEIFIARHFDPLGVKAAVGVGALLDFLSGRVVRAPGFFRKARLEWVWRLAREPGRLWRRYLLGNSQFLWRVIRRR